MTKKEPESSMVEPETFKEVSKYISDDNKSLFVFYVSSKDNVKVKKYKITFDTEMVFK